MNPRAGEADGPLAGYFFYGEETYLAHLFLEELRAARPGMEDSPVRRFDLSVQRWPEILDEARSPSLLFSTGRILLIESPHRKRDNVPSPYEKLTESDKRLLSDYFADPTPATSLVFIYPGKIRPTAPLVRFFSGLSSQVRIEEVKRLRERELVSWVRRRFASRQNTATPEAVGRLVELVGRDLRALDGEVEKVSTYAGPKQEIEAEDVDAVSGWIKSYVEWELAEHLERADYRQCLLVMHKLLEQEGVAPLRILALVAGFFRDILLAKLRLQEGLKDRKAIFREIKPQIRESYRGLYERQFRQLFSLVEDISESDLQHILDRLRDLDLKLKSTTLAFRFLMEGFLFEYCWIRRYGRPINRT